MHITSRSSPLHSIRCSACLQVHHGYRQLYRRYYPDSYHTLSNVTAYARAYALSCVSHLAVPEDRSIYRPRGSMCIVNSCVHHTSQKHESCSNTQKFIRIAEEARKRQAGKCRHQDRKSALDTAATGAAKIVPSSLTAGLAIPSARPLPMPPTTRPPPPPPPQHPPAAHPCEEAQMSSPVW